MLKQDDKMCVTDAYQRFTYDTVTLLLTFRFFSEWQNTTIVLKIASN